MSKPFTVCCLFYGDYPHMVERLLKSLDRAEWFPFFNLRIVWSDLSQESQDALREGISRLHGPDKPLEWCRSGSPPYHKYPEMRRMFKGEGLPAMFGPAIDGPDMVINTTYIMWFDDDSWVLGSAPKDWFQRVQHKMQQFDMIGAPYWKYAEGNQPQFIMDQPWYTGKALRMYRDKERIDFITGGWWTIRTEILHKHDWPPEEFHHNGGDVMLGELCRQQGYPTGRFIENLAINANDRGEQSKAPRRGAALRPIGVDYTRPVIVTAPKPNWMEILDGDA